MSRDRIGETIPSPADSLTVALSLAKAGWPVFPVRLARVEHPVKGHVTDKIPLVKWLEGATTDPERIASWWGLDFPDAWIGVHAARAGLVVVDIDKPKKGDGRDGHAELAKAGIDLPETFHYGTRSGGQHHVYRAPEGKTLRIAQNHPVPGVDIRAGHGLMVYYGPVLTSPPSLAPAPAWSLLEVAKPKSGGMLIANDVDAARWLAAQRPGKPTKATRKLAKRLHNDTGHDDMLDVVNRLVAAGTSGEPGIAGLLTSAKSRYFEGRPDRRRDFDNALAGSVAHYGMPPVSLDIPKAERKALKAQASEPPRPKGGSTAARPIEDSPLAVELADIIRDGWAFTEATGLLRWTGRVWEVALGMALVERVRWELARIELEEHAKALTWSDEKMRQQRLDKLRGLLSTKKARDVTALVTGILADARLEVDAHPDLLNTPSGVVDLRTLDVLPHDPALMLTKMTAAAYVPGATDPDWTAALEAIPEKVRPWLQVRLGQGLTGHMTPDDKLLILQGGGGNGKSTIIDACRVAQGGYVVTIPERLLLSNPGDHPTELTTLQGAHSAFIEELPEGRNLNVKRLKDTVGTPVLTARRIGKDNVTWRATHTLFLSTNYLPVVAETDAGTWRRLALVRFPKRYLDADDPKRKPGDLIADPGIRARLGAQPSEAALAWLIEGAHRWYAEGFPPTPKAVVKDTAAWRAEADPVLAYAADRLELDPGYAIPTADLASDFNDWLRARGHKEWSQQLINARFAGHEAMAEVERKRVKFSAKTQPSRPPMSLRPVPANTQAWLGVRFKSSEPSAPLSPEMQSFEARLRGD
jgi:putative DNA primase/helicase